MDITNISLYGVSLPLFIMVAVGLAKKLGFPIKFAPHLAAGIGIGGGIAVAITAGLPIVWGIMAGVFLGAVACGVYSQGKSPAADTSSDTESINTVGLNESLINEFKEAVIDVLHKTTSA